MADTSILTSLESGNIKLTIPGRPTGYRSKRKAAGNSFRARLAASIREQHPGEPLAGPLFVEFRFCFAPPRELPASVRRSMITGETDAPKEPRAYFLGAALRDACAACCGSLWGDDRQVVDFSARLAWAAKSGAYPK